MILAVPIIERSSAFSVATYDFLDNVVAKTISRTVATNVATLKTDRAHRKNIGDLVYVLNMGDATYNGYRLITAVPTDTSFSYALTHADEGETSDIAGRIHDPIIKPAKGFFVRSGANNIRYCPFGGAVAQSASRQVASNVAIIKTRYPHGLKVGNEIFTQGFGGTGYNGSFTVTVVNDPQTFRFALTHGDEGPVADSGGLIDETITKTVTAQVYFVDPELVRKVLVTGTTATGLIAGYTRDY